MKRLGVVVAAALVATLTIAVPSRTPAVATGHSVSTLGGPGEGPALQILQGPGPMAASGSAVFVADPAFDVIREIDLSTGQSAVFAPSPHPDTVINDVVAAPDGSVFAVGVVNNVGGTYRVPRGGPYALFDSNVRPIAVDPAGVVYRTTGHTVERHTGAGWVRMAGTGTAGYSGDGGPALAATFNAPGGLAADTAYVYVADGLNGRIRRIDAAGIVSSVGPVFQRDDGYKSVGSVWVAPDRTLVGRGAGPGDDPVTVEIRPDSTTAPVVVPDLDGNGEGGYLAFDGASALLALDSHRLRDLANGRAGLVHRRTGPSWTHVAGAARRYLPDGSPAADAQLFGPTAVSGGPGGDIYLAFADAFEVVRVDPAGILHRVAGTGTDASTGDGGPAGVASLRSPCAVHAAATGEVFIAESREGQHAAVRRVDTAGTITTVAGRGPTPLAPSPDRVLARYPATSSVLTAPCQLATDQGDLLIADDHRVLRIEGTDAVTLAVVPHRIRALTVTPSGVIVATTETAWWNVSRFGGAVSMRSPYGWAQAADGADNIYVDTPNSYPGRLRPGGSDVLPVGRPLALLPSGDLVGGDRVLHGAALPAAQATYGAVAAAVTGIDLARAIAGVGASPSFAFDKKAGVDSAGSPVDPVLSMRGASARVDAPGPSTAPRGRAQGGATSVRLFGASANPVTVEGASAVAYAGCGAVASPATSVARITVGTTDLGPIGSEPRSFALAGLRIDVNQTVVVGDTVEIVAVRVVPLVVSAGVTDGPIAVGYARVTAVCP